MFAIHLPGESDCAYSSIPRPPNADFFGEQGERNTSKGLALQTESAAVSSIQTLPPELLAEIFLYCQAAPIGGGSREPVVSQICYLWSHIALSTPRLWHSVIIDVPSRGAIERTSTYLKRSGTSSLCITISVKVPISVDTIAFDQLMRQCVDVATVIRDQTSRVRHLSISAPSQFASAFFANVNGLTRTLQTLECRVEAGPISFSAQFSSHYFRPTTQLLLQMKKDQLYFNRELSFALDELRLNVMDDMPSKTLGNALSGCVNLRKLVLVPQWVCPSTHPRLASPRATPALSLPSLETLLISRLNGLDRLLRAALFPALQTLKITEFLWSDRFAVTIIDLLETCRFLRSVVLCAKGGTARFPVVPEGGVVCLPLLDKLVVSNGADITDLLPRLTLPRLETLDIAGRIGEKFFGFVSRAPLIKTLVFDGRNQGSYEPELSPVPVTPAGSLGLLYLRELTLRGRAIDFCPLMLAPPDKRDPMPGGKHYRPPHAITTHLPSLTTLRLTSCSSLSPLMGSRSVKPLSHSRAVLYPPLKTLILDSVNMRSTSFTDLLDCTPSLTSLRIHKSHLGMRLDDDGNALLALLGTCVPLRCMQLKLLELSACSGLAGQNVFDISQLRGKHGLSV